MRKLSCPPEAETLGALLHAFTDNLQGEDTRPIVEKHEIADVDPNGWYRVMNLLNALNEIAENPNVVFNMVAIGMKIGEVVPMPPEMKDPSLPDVLMIWDDLYQGLHRNANLGDIVCKKVADKHYTTTHSNPYPDDMSYGILYAYGKRFLPTGTQFTVFYDQDSPARDYGGTSDTTIIHIKWE